MAPQSGMKRNTKKSVRGDVVTVLIHEKMLHCVLVVVLLLSVNCAVGCDPGNADDDTGLTDDDQSDDDTQQDDDSSQDDDDASPTPITSLADADATIEGVLTGSEVGHSVAILEDLNGDGYAEVLVGDASYGSTGEFTGSAYLFHGPVYGFVSTTEAVLTLNGEASLDAAGVSVCNSGDLNNDGMLDVLIGASGYDYGDQDTGAVYVVFLPRSGTMSLSEANVRITGESRGDHAGHAVAGGFDFNGDGLSDVLVGAPQNEENGSESGAAYLIYGPLQSDVELVDADLTIRGDEAHTRLGDSVASAGDVNGDGLNDIIVGATEIGGDTKKEGSVCLIHGGTERPEVLLSSCDAVLVGESVDDLAGFAVAGVGDVNADGFDDIVIGAIGNDAGGENSGAVYLVHGPLDGIVPLSLAQTRFVGGHSHSYAGFDVASAGDFNGDGYSDYIFGAYNAGLGGAESGAAYLKLGPTEGEVLLAYSNYVFTGARQYAYAGYAVSGGADINADGYSDVSVGAPAGNMHYQQITGAVHVVFGNE